MSNTSAGSVGGGNEGQTDSGRGSSMNFGFNKAGRNTGKVAASMGAGANGNSVDSNKRTASDPRLAG